MSTGLWDERYAGKHCVICQQPLQWDEVFDCVENEQPTNQLGYSKRSDGSNVFFHLACYYSEARRNKNGGKEAERHGFI